jgi:hypothetical protein
VRTAHQHDRIPAPARLYPEFVVSAMTVHTTVRLVRRPPNSQKKT